MSVAPSLPFFCLRRTFYHACFISYDLAFHVKGGRKEKSTAAVEAFHHEAKLSIIHGSSSIIMYCYS